jgi:hypothetical protein
MRRRSSRRLIELIGIDQRKQYVHARARRHEIFINSGEREHATTSRRVQTPAQSQQCQKARALFPLLVFARETARERKRDICACGHRSRICMGFMAYYRPSSAATGLFARHGVPIKAGGESIAVF